jgi:hypothetical protein
MLFLDYTFSYVLQLQLVFTANWCCFIVFYFKNVLEVVTELGMDREKL